MPLLDFLDSVEQTDRKLVWLLAEKYPFLLRLAESGELMEALRPRLKAMDDGYATNPDRAIVELERWHEWKRHNYNSATEMTLEEERAKIALAEANARIAELEAGNSIKIAELETSKTRGLRRWRKSVLWAGVVLLVATGLYPPWVSLWGTVGGLKSPFGYHWIFNPPAGGYLMVDAPRLLIEWVLVAVISAALLFAPPSFTVTAQTWRGFRWLGRVVGGPVLTFAVLLSFVWLFPDRTGHRLPLWEAAIFAVACTLWPLLPHFDGPKLIKGVGWAGLAVWALLEGMRRNEWLGSLVSRMRFDDWGIPFLIMALIASLVGTIWVWDNERNRRRGTH